MAEILRKTFTNPFGYPIKEELKTLGFRWDSGYSFWKAKTEKVDFEKLNELGIKEFEVESNE